MIKSMTWLRHTALALMLALILPVAALAAGQVGEQAANFTLTDPQSGTAYTLSDYDGKVRFLFFFGYS